MTVRLAVRLDADLEPLRDGMAEAEGLLERFGADAGGLSDTLAGLGNAGSAAFAGVADAISEVARKFEGVGDAADRSANIVSAMADKIGIAMGLVGTAASTAASLIEMPFRAIWFAFDQGAHVIEDWNLWTGQFKSIISENIIQPGESVESSAGRAIASLGALSLSTGGLNLASSNLSAYRMGMIGIASAESEVATASGTASSALGSLTTTIATQSVKAAEQQGAFAGVKLALADIGITGLGAATSLLGLISTITLWTGVASVVIGSVSAASSASQETEAEIKRLADLLKLTEYGAGITAKAAQVAIQELQRTVTLSRGELGATMQELIKFRELSTETLTKTFAIGVQFADRSGQDPVAVIRALENSFGDLGTASENLRAINVTLSASQINQIEVLSDSGDKAGAYAVILAAVNDRVVEYTDKLTDAKKSQLEFSASADMALSNIGDAWRTLTVFVSSSASDMFEVIKRPFRDAATATLDAFNAMVNASEAQIKHKIEGTKRLIEAAQSASYDSSGGILPGVADGNNDVGQLIELLARLEQQLVRVTSSAKDSGQALAGLAKQQAETLRQLQDELIDSTSETEGQITALRIGESAGRLRKISDQERESLENIARLRNLAVQSGAPAGKLEEYDEAASQIKALADAQLRADAAKVSSARTVHNVLAEIANEEARQIAEVTQASSNSTRGGSGSQASGNDELTRRIDLIRQAADAEREAADTNAKLISGMSQEVEASKLSGVQKAVVTAQRRLSADATDKERQEVADLATQLYKENDATRDALDPNAKLIESLQAELIMVGLSNRDRTIEQALRRLSADATDDQRRMVQELSAALFDEKQAIDASNRATEVMTRLRRELAEINLSDSDRAAARAADQLGEHATDAARAEAEALARMIVDGKEAKKITESLIDPAERYKQELEKINHLLEVGAISQETYGQAADKSYRKMLDGSREFGDGAERAWLKWRDAATDSAAQAERVFNTTMKGMEDVFVQFVTTGELDFDHLTQRIVEDLARIFWQRQVMAPIGDALFGKEGESGGGLFSSLFSGGGGEGGGIMSWLSGMFHEGGVAGSATTSRETPAWLFAGAPRYHDGGIAGLAPGEVPAVLKVGEVVGWPEQLRQAFGGSNAVMATDASSSYVINVDARGSGDPAATARMVSQAVAATMAQVVPGIIDRASRLASTSAQASVFDAIHRQGGRF